MFGLDTLSSLFSGNFSNAWDNFVDPVSDLFSSGSTSSLGGNVPASKGGSWFDGFLDKAFSPESILGGAKALGGSLLAGSAPGPKSLEDLVAEKRALGEVDTDLAIDRFKQLEELKKALGIGGGGGGGGGGSSQAATLAYYRARDRYQGRLAAATDRVAQSQNASALTLQAMNSLAEAATRPLRR